MTIAGKDVDYLVILTSLAGSKNNINFLKQGKGRTESKMQYTLASMMYGSVIKDNILFLHAFSGADTTSAFFKQGKLKFVNLMGNDGELQELVAVSKKPHADPKRLLKQENPSSFICMGTKNMNPLAT